MASENKQQYRHYLTTIDNPFDPVDQQESWRLFDKLHHYDSEEKTARLACTSDEHSDSLNQQYIREAILELMAADPLNIYIMVQKPI